MDLFLEGFAGMGATWINDPLIKAVEAHRRRSRGPESHDVDGSPTGTDASTLPPHTVLKRAWKGMITGILGENKSIAIAAGVPGEPALLQDILPVP